MLHVHIRRRHVHATCMLVLYCTRIWHVTCMDSGRLHACFMYVTCLWYAYNMQDLMIMHATTSNIKVILFVSKSDTLRKGKQKLPDKFYEQQQWPENGPSSKIMFITPLISIESRYLQQHSMVFNCKKGLDYFWVDNLEKIEIGCWEEQFTYK